MQNLDRNSTITRTIPTTKEVGSITKYPGKNTLPITSCQRAFTTYGYTIRLQRKYLKTMASLLSPDWRLDNEVLTSYPNEYMTLRCMLMLYNFYFFHSLFVCGISSFILSACFTCPDNVCYYTDET